MKLYDAQVNFVQEHEEEWQGAISKMHYAQDTDARNAFSLALMIHSSRVHDKNWVPAKDIPASCGSRAGECSFSRVRGFISLPGATRRSLKMKSRRQESSEHVVSRCLIDEALVRGSRSFSFSFNFVRSYEFLKSLTGITGTLQQFRILHF